MSPVAVARSFSNGIATHYVLPDDVVYSYHGTNRQNQAQRYV